MSERPTAALAESPEALAWGPEQHQSLREEIQSGSGRYDLVVVGAGITGAGVARDAAARGLSVLVVEAQDVAYGTSSRSSRLIHGGVRYLEQFEFGLVFEALRERDRLYRLAEHLVRPARFVFPTYKGDRLGPWSLRAGLTIYDALRLFRGKGHQYLRPDRAIEVEPLLGREGLRGALWYEDAVTDDARLTLTVLQDAMRLGAKVLTYAPVEALEPKEGGTSVRFAEGSIHADSVVVATGPWTGERLLGLPGRGALSLSKGVHVVVRASACPVRHPVVVQVPGQRRILFAVPWGSRTYLGTTDSAYEGDPGRSQVTPDEELEVLSLVKRVLPHATLEPESIVSVWSGIRPLVRPPGVAEGDTVELARTHRIIEGHPGVFGIVGGKLTTYRQMAEDVVDEVAGERRRRGLSAAPRACSTASRPLVPGSLHMEDRLGAERLQRYESLVADLLPRHGALTEALVSRVEASPELAAPLVEQLPYREVEVEQALMHEGVVHLIDLLRRRLPLALTDPRLGWGVAERLATRMAELRGGDQRFIDDELERYRSEVEGETGRDPAKARA